MAYSREEFERDQKGETGDLIAEMRELGIRLDGPMETGEEEYFEIWLYSPSGLEWRTKVFTPFLLKARRDACEIARMFRGSERAGKGSRNT